MGAVRIARSARGLRFSIKREERVNYIASTSLRQVVNVGSNANNGTNAGLFYVNSNNDGSNANRNIGARLSAIQILDVTSAPLGEKSCHKSLVAKANSLAGRTR